MKKYIIALAIVSFVPSVAFASWWNPLSWGEKTDQSNEVSSLKAQIATLQQAIASLSATTSPSTTTVGATKTVTVVKYLPCPTASNPVSTPPTPVVTVPVQPVVQVAVPPAPVSNPASVTFSGNDPSISPPLAQPVSVTTSGSGQYLGLPVLTLYLVPSSNDIYLHTLTVNLNKSGQGTINTAYLYQGVVGPSSRPILTGVVANGTVTFTIKSSDAQQVQLSTSFGNSNNLLTLKVDVSGLANSGDSEVVSASVSNVTANTSSGQNVNVSGSASGNVITVKQP